MNPVEGRRRKQYTKGLTHLGDGPMRRLFHPVYDVSGVLSDTWSI